MSEFGYKVTLEADQCGVKRFVAFHDHEELSYDEAGSVAAWKAPSMTCARCGADHKPTDFFPVGVEVELH